MSEPTDITPEEIMVFCIARQVSDGEIVAQGLATPLVAAGYLLARSLHAPNLYFTSAIGQGVCRQPAPLGLTRIEALWLDRSIEQCRFCESCSGPASEAAAKGVFSPRSDRRRRQLQQYRFWAGLSKTAPASARNRGNPRRNDLYPRNSPVRTAPFSSHFCGETGLPLRFGTSSRSTLGCRASIPGERPGSIRF